MPRITVSSSQARNNLQEGGPWRPVLDRIAGRRDRGLWSWILADSLEWLRRLWAVSKEMSEQEEGVAEVRSSIVVDVCRLKDLRMVATVEEVRQKK